MNRKPKKRSISVKWVVRVLTTVSVAVIYYIVFSLLFDTPIEYELKKSTQKLQKHYTNLEKRYDSLVQVLDNLNERDSAVYKLIYEADPYTPSFYSGQQSAQSRAQLESLTNKELGDIFSAKLATVTQKSYNTAAIIDNMSRVLAQKIEGINSIPSIQPIDNPDLRLLATSFGRRVNPFYKTMQNHTGIDYSVPVGTAVFATADGVISEIQTRGHNNGLSLKLDHSNGYTTIYSFLSRTYGNVGQKVSRGDVIAFTGNSGMSYAPHLHYEIQYKGKPVDPVNYMFLELDVRKLEDMRSIASHAMQSFD